MSNPAGRLSRDERNERGVRGERATRTIMGLLTPEEHLVAHDLPWPGRPQANIDHLVVNAQGVFVLDTKNWSGTVTATDGELRQNGNSRASVLEKMRDQGAAINSMITAVRVDNPTLPPVPIHPILVLAAQTGISEHITTVHVVTLDQLLPALTTKPPVLDAQQVRTLAYHLAETLDFDREVTLLNAATARAQARTNPLPRREKKGTKKPSARAELAGILRLLLMGAGLLFVITQPDLVASFGHWISTTITNLITPN
ncbi:nuclease-related domain-containing protein [Jonesia denitrificans]|uniref:NERD domain protein n=1 Tax=Jonesia denitrificans (strain ATCC 14870 / DSM 20603 / BCRC 15368 / CIP 55.134 / JCM 11481 / NBRC 15587 / NCTC 10816 / Prevot 55134) TaxID=471856 RepID=C7QZ76_JONDD|nr:nuclease-related domain-containing protein [Jonesia denitrificans]ACV07984.1 NERD domain protein [Jonesia denitrificans DSM 20603]ASE08325.1 NERD domain-containing protein [Jonesia denitrificans]QXB42924.1 NERD domain-containing protein [Jonesia denitrificans]SQH19959.1 Nuclease-related domain [Jonesia denitrificans]